MTLSYVVRSSLFFVAILCAASIEAGEPLKWRMVSGKREPVTRDGEEFLDGGGLMEFLNVPDGDFALRFDFLSRPGGSSAKMLFRGPTLGEGMVLNMSTAPWRGFQNNVAMGDPQIFDSVYLEEVLPRDEPEWWTIKAQMWNGRLMAKAWKSSEAEPLPRSSDGFDITKPPNTKWIFDFPCTFDTTGPVGLESPSRLRNLVLIPVEPTAHRVPKVDNRRRRFGAPREEWLIDVNVEEREETIVVHSELAMLIFDRSRCAISLARVRDEKFPVESLPDLRIVDAEGREFRQRYAIDGDLRVLPEAGDRWIVLAGRMTPRTCKGAPFAASFQFEYRIHRQTGLIAVRAVPCLPRNAATKVRQLVFVGELNDRPEQHIDDYQRVSSGHFFGKGNRALPHDSRADQLISGRRSSLATWGNGRCAFQVTPSSFRHASIDPQLLKDETAYRHLAIGTRNGHRFLDMAFVNRRPGEEITIRSGEVSYGYTFSFVPWRRYRPYIELACSSRVWADSRLWTVSYEQERLQLMAEMGVTLHGLGYPPYGLLADSAYKVRVGRQVEQSHYFGIKDMVAWVGGTRWPRERALDAGWITLDEANRAARHDREQLHERINHNAEIPDQLCLNDPAWQKMTVDRINMPVLERFNSSAVYWDWTWDIYYCDNVAHGDDGVSLSPIGHIEMIDRFRSQAAELPERPLVMGCTYDAHSTPSARLDMFNPGESGKGWWLPNRAEHNLIYTSLLQGTQCIYHTAGGVANDTPRVYELALARCATVHLGDEEWDPPAHDPPGTPGGFDAEERAMWIRYMTPLNIFGVQTASYRHPFDSDYAEFAEASEGVTAVIYFKNGRALVVVVKEDEKAIFGQLRLRTEKLGVAGQTLMMLDPLDSTVVTVYSNEGELDLKNIDLSDGPRFFVVQTEGALPTLLWHSPSTWQAKVTNRIGESTVALTGVPGSKLDVYLWCAARGRPTSVFGGKLKSFDESSRLAIVETTANADAHAEVRLRW